MIPDKSYLTQEQYRRMVSENLVHLIFNNTQFEDIEASFEQTTKIINGEIVSGVSNDDINVINQLKLAWRYILKEDRSISLNVEQNINMLVERYDSLDSGKLRTGNVTAELGNNYGEWNPPKINYEAKTNSL